MNAYRIDAGEYDQYISISYEDRLGYYETTLAFDFVFAETRGQAWASFLKEWPRLEWTAPKTIELFFKDVARQRGVAARHDPIYAARSASDQWAVLQSPHETREEEQRREREEEADRRWHHLEESGVDMSKLIGDTRRKAE